MKNIAVMVSGGGTNLQALIDAAADKRIDARIVAVISSNAEAYALKRAEVAGIPAFVCAKKDFADICARDLRIIEILKNVGAELVFLAGYLGLIGADMVREYPNKIINIHPALLPKFGGYGMYGINVHRAVLAEKERYTGATAHFVNEIVDGGEIIRQKKLRVRAGDTPETLQQRLLEKIEHKLIVEVAEMLCKNVK